MRTRVSKGFTLVEILIVVVILGILAAIVIPQFTNASQEAQVGNVQTQLQTLRSQIELFRVRNNGNPPALVGAGTASFSDLMTPPAGQQAYVRTAPINPRNKSSDVVESATPILSANDGPAVAGGAGWLYNSTTGEIAAMGFDEEVGSATYGQWVTATP
jgi:general secretion pathway protein G